jgi:uncharacterized protein (TIGR02284 family)
MAEKQALVELLNDLIALDHDAVEAYRAAIDRLNDPPSKDNLASFMGDHERHIRELTEHVRRLAGTPRSGPDFKRVLTKGKVVIADLIGDKAILQAMKSNEETTNRQYEAAVQRNDLTPDVRLTLERNLADERRHRAWIVARIEGM